LGAVMLMSVMLTRWAWREELGSR